MTEAEWLACTDDRSLLGFMTEEASIRKRRLFACARLNGAWLLGCEQTISKPLRT